LDKGDANIGIVANIFLRSLNAAPACGVQTNVSVFFINWYKGITFSPSQIRKRLRVARLPVNFWTSLRHVDSSVFSMALIFAGFASIPQLDTRKPSNLPTGTPKVYLVGFSFIWNPLRFAKVSQRSFKRVRLSLVLMMKLSTYTCTFLPI
jgi:hypothetical protein